MKNIMIINREIFRLAVPSIVSNITVPLLGLVDVAITGHMGEARYMAAIAVGSMVFNIIYWLFSFLRFGTGGLTAQEFGKAHLNIKGTAYILLRSQCISIIMAMLLLLLQVPLFEVAMWLIEPEPQLKDIIRTYYNICIWGTIPSLALYSFTGWFVGMQNTKLPMIISITQNVVNIALSYMFVYLMGMKIEGVALGTLIAQWCGALMALVLLIRNYRELWRGVSLKSPLFRRGWGRFLAVNRTLFYRTLFLVSVNLYFIVAGAKGGAVILAVNSVLMQMFILYTYVMDGFAFAAEALCGRFYGAKEKESFNLALKGVWRWSIVLTIAYTLVYAFGGENFMQLLTDDAAIRKAALDYLPWAIAIPFCGIAAFVWDGVFVGITNTKGMLWATAVGAISFFLIYFSLYDLMHNHALWLAFNAYLFMRGATQWAIWKKNTLPPPSL